MNDQAQEPVTDTALLDETHGSIDLAFMVDEDGSIVFGTPDDDLGDLYNDEYGATDQAKDRYVVTIQLPKAKTKTAQAVIPQGAAGEAKVIIQA
jgi:hypothetical protein